jgi:nucleotide-binding universal stress UspA family protein
MSALSILVAATGAPDDEAAIAVAADLAKSHESVAVVVTFAPLPIGVAMPAFAGAGAAPMVWRGIEDRQEAIAARVEAVVGEQARRFGLARRRGAGGALVKAAARDSGWATLMGELPLADFTIVAQSSVAGEGPWTGPLGEALMEARSPVYVARDGESSAGRPAAIAWDGSPEAGRAIRAALPLLKQASEVAILQDPDGLDTDNDAGADPDRVNRYLLAHDVAAGAVIRVRGRRIGPTLVQAATAFGAGLLVSGAYRHSRLGEAIFGGATRSFLTNAEGPHLLISH